MKAARLERVLRGVLLAAAPLALDGCIFGETSCPDDGYEPPLVSSKAVAADFAAGGPLSAQQCAEVCTDGTTVLTCVRESAESVLCLNERFPCVGRRPAGLVAEHRPRSAFARHLAEAAWLEAASVTAFRDLRCELRGYGAPRKLLRAASRSARDERRHARSSKALARRFGVAVPAARREQPPSRSLVTLAVENAVEGCVRETWGALIALRQAEQAADLGVRATMARIAPDEVRHAELAWAVHRWLTPRLTPRERLQVLAAREAALAELRRDAAHELPTDARLGLGMPSAAESAALLDRFAETLRLA